MREKGERFSEVGKGENMEIAKEHEVDMTSSGAFINNVASAFFFFRISTNDYICLFKNPNQ